MVDNSHLVAEAERLALAGRAAGVTLSVLGATAFRIHCPEYVELHRAMGREISDIDFAAYSKQDREIEHFFLNGLETPFRAVRAALTPELFAHRRIYEQPETGTHVDIFLDELAMCHTIPFRGRLELDAPTLPLAELTLEKLQIVTLNEKDIKDMLILLAAHPVGDHDRETINGQYIAQLLSGDWGFYYTCTVNLGKIRAGLERYRQLFSADDARNILERIEQLTAMIEQAPKSLKWKMRAKVGPKVKWYNDVDDVERAEHLQDLG